MASFLIRDTEGEAETLEGCGHEPGTPVVPEAEGAVRYRPWFQGSVLQSCQFCSLKPPSLWSFAMAGIGKLRQTDRQTPLARSYKCRGRDLQATGQLKSSAGTLAAAQRQDRLLLRPCTLSPPSSPSVSALRASTTSLGLQVIDPDIRLSVLCPDRRLSAPDLHGPCAHAAAQFCPLG